MINSSQIESLDDFAGALVSALLDATEALPLYFLGFVGIEGANGNGTSQ